MKSNFKIVIVILSLILVYYSNVSLAQCDKKKMCKDDMGDFDYTSQSSYAQLSPGDTATVKIVVYSGKAYRIMLCGDPVLGDIKYKIVSPVRKAKRSFTVKEIQESGSELKPDAEGFVSDNGGNKFKLEANGNLTETKTVNKKKVTITYIKNGDSYSSSDGQIIPTTSLVQTPTNSVRNDTTWTSSRYTDEELIFDSKNNKSGKNYWEEGISKTQRIFIKIEIPPGDKTAIGCLGVNIGTKLLSSKNFLKDKK